MPPFWLFFSPAFWNNATQGSDTPQPSLKKLKCFTLVHIHPSAPWLLPLRSINNSRLWCLPYRIFLQQNCFKLAEAINLCWWYPQQSTAKHIPMPGQTTGKTSGNKGTVFDIHFLFALCRVSLRRSNTCMQFSTGCSPHNGNEKSNN